MPQANIPQAAAAGPGAEGKTEQSNTADPSSASNPALIVASLLLVPAACYGFVRLFQDGSAVLPIIAAAVVSGGLTVLLRTARVSLLGSFIFSALGLAFLLELRYAPGTQQLGLLPTRATLDSFAELARQGVVDFRKQRAPVETGDPFVAASIIAAWTMSFLTDWGALRLRLAFEPVLPASLIFLFASILGSGEFQKRSTIVFAAAVIFWAITQRTTNLASGGVWLLADARRGPRGIARSGFAIGAVALLAGLFVGPAFPGADADELYYWRNRGDSTRYVISPYVSIQNQLAEQTDVTMFTVIADHPSYWRVAGLDTYEDGFWQTKGKFEPEAGRLPGTTAIGGTESQPLRQEFKIEALSSIWLPAAFSPSRIIESDVPATWNSETSSLTVSSEHSTSDGAVYVLESNITQFSAEQLNATSTAVPQDIAEQYLELPNDLTERVASEALAITAGTTTRYEEMLALQNHFREFEYSINLSKREGDPIGQFLDERIGFCQQFSGTFALMARSLGAPARVAVGFTWGEPTGNENEYRVSGRHTHAWPEVWFEGLGWVAFEPTPGRGAPDASHTELSQSQDAEPAQDEDGPTTTIAPINTPGTDFDSDLLGLNDGETPQPGDLAANGNGFSVSWRLLGVIGLAFAYLGGLPLFYFLRRRTSLQRASTPARKIDVAWEQASEALELGYSLKREGWETRSEFAQRVSRKRRVPSDAVNKLAHVSTIARYSRQKDLGNEVLVAQQQSAAIVKTVKNHVPVWRRWLHDLDPRRILSTN